MPDIKYKWFQDGGFIIRDRTLGGFELLEVPQFGGDEIHIAFFASVDLAKKHADFLS